MFDLPDPVRDYMQLLMMETRSPAYLFVDKQARLREWGGELSVYGITALCLGEAIGKQVYILEGLLPLEDIPLHVPCIETASGVFADLHLLPGRTGDWILLLDASVDEYQRHSWQQKANELDLLREKLSRILDQHLGKDVATNLVQNLFTSQEEGERKEITILFADVRGFTVYSEKNPPGTVFKTLNVYLRTMMLPILEADGVVDNILGDAVMGLFGMFPTTGSPHQQAVRAAFRMLDAVKQMNQRRTAEQDTTLDIGLGIASGPVALGMLGSRDRRKFSVIGHSVNLAARLESRALPGQILIDAQTYANLGSLQQRFAPLSLTLKGIAEPVQAFSASRR